MTPQLQTAQQSYHQQTHDDMIPSSSSSCSSSSSSSSQPSAVPSRNDWWIRSIVRRTISFVENDLECVLQQSPFLAAAAAAAAANTNNLAALFHRCEIRTGAVLGTGGFSVVYEIVGFDLDRAVHDRLSAAQRAAREHMRQTCIDPSTGAGRYAIKHLQEKLLLRKSSNKSNSNGFGGYQQQHNWNAAKDFSYAASDLAVEACFLSAIDHPNVLSLRGLPVDGLHALADGFHDGYFIITDRLVDTLDKRVKQWKGDKKTGKEETTDDNEQQLEAAAAAQAEEMLLYEKMDYALQLAEALQHLHDRRCIFRDLKPHNIGFNAAGQLQLFDFGLCREVPAGGCHMTDVFDMSGVGTRRYMAVEVINDGRYNVKADVYGWSMVFWEMLTGTKPYPLYSVEDHRIAVCQGGERPPVDLRWPKSLQTLLQQSWLESVPDRLTIRDVCCTLRSIMIQQQKRMGIILSSSEPPSMQQELAMTAAVEDAPQSPTGVMDEVLLQYHDDNMNDNKSERNCYYRGVVSNDTKTKTNAGNNNGVVAVAISFQSIPSSLQIPMPTTRNINNNNNNNNNNNERSMAAAAAAASAAALSPSNAIPPNDIEASFDDDHHESVSISTTAEDDDDAAASSIFSMFEDISLSSELEIQAERNDEDEEQHQDRLVVVNRHQEYHPFLPSLEVAVPSQSLIG